MKLARITKTLRSVQVRIMLSGDLNACIERYAQYYEHIHGDTVVAGALIPEILRVFLDADREFQSWSRPMATSNHAASPRRLHPTAAPRHRPDLPQRGTG